jgi:hypothetical protein
MTDKQIDPRLLEAARYSPTLKHMINNGLPPTREKFISMNYLGPRRSLALTNTRPRCRCLSGVTHQRSLTRRHVRGLSRWPALSCK